MTITLFGATGMVGKYIVRKALAQGHTIKAFGRNVQSLIDADLRNTKLVAVKGYVFDEGDVYKAIQGSDMVISVLGGAFNGKDKSRSLGIKNIVAQMKRAQVKRIVALGGKGILLSENDELLLDLPDYPEEYLPVGKEHLQAYLYLKESDLDWTIIGAPNLVDEDGSGHYTTSSEYPPQPDNGFIRAGDLAEFMLKEATANNYLQQRVGISTVS
ncbi:NAD(P)-dependent oxidoreductase [Aridibaculum aurantiacum]|uniref:NAD(P)-dependent oxidoreductase n=1 Tax=Aridibaculum aurantiacum TaxID=2810307 RepID=UPI001A95B36C|nr:NAD(P)H-binding protein [Aridibaculum aurantiacum]